MVEFLSIKICLLRMRVYRPSATAWCFRRPTRPSPSESSLFRMQRIRPAVSPRALSGKVHLIGACRGFGAIKEAIKLQIVGLTHDVYRTVLRGSPETGSFS